MKRIFYSGLVIALTLTSCSDVPAPYDLLSQLTGGGKTMPYKNASLNNGWTAYALTENNPWSQGSSYTQATGYQDWAGTGSKTNVATEGYLISPAINTTCASGKVKISFDQTIRYTNQVSSWQQNEKIYASNDYHGNTDHFSDAHWIELPYTPTASTYSDWTTYPSGDIQLPDTLVGCDSVYVAFYFKSPASSSTTWELMNFVIEEGVAGATPDTPVITPSEPKGDGTQASPYNVAKTQAVCGALAAGETSQEVYVEGIISQIKAIDITSYGNAQYYISDDGTTANQFYIYRGFGLNGAKFTSESDIKVGDKVVVKGKLTNYNGTLEMATGNSIVSLNSTTSGGTDQPTTGDAAGNGTETSPYNVKGIIAYTSALAADAATAEAVYFQGIVCSTKDISPTYGNASFYISDDGKDTGDKFYVFRCLGLGNKAITAADEVQVGDKVVICGKVVNYYGNTPETVQKEAYIVKLERNGASQGTDEPSTPATSDGISISGTTVTLTNSAATLGTETETIDLGAYCQSAGMENAAEVSEVKGTGVTLLFSCGENTKYPPKYYTATKGVRCYANNTITFTPTTKAIAKVVMTCDSYNGQDYVGQTTATLTAKGNTLVYTNAGTGTTQLRVKAMTITYAK